MTILPTENKRILLISRQGGLGGTERRMTDLSEFLSRNKCEVLLHFSATTKSEGIFSKINNSPIGRFFRMVKLIRKFKPHLINAFDLETGIYVFIAKRIIRNKAVLISGYGAENITDSRTQKILRKNLFLADYYICNSSKASENLKTYIRSKRIVSTIRNGLNTKRLEKSIPEEEEIIELCRNKFVIGYIGKLDNIKHGERIFYLAQKMLKQNQTYPKPLHFIIIGDGPNRKNVTKELNIADDSIRNSITVTGPIKDAGSLAKYFDIGLLCSDSEGFPNVLLEYMYFGVPWVSTNVGDIQEIIKLGNSGIVVENWELQKFSEICSSLLKNEHQNKELSLVGKKVFQENFTIDRMGRAYLEIYQSLLN